MPAGEDEAPVAGEGGAPLSEAPTVVAADRTEPRPAPVDPSSAAAAGSSIAGSPSVQSPSVGPSPVGPPPVGPSLTKPGDPPTPADSGARTAGTPPPTRPGEVVPSATPPGPVPRARRPARGTGLLIGVLVAAVVLLTAGIAFLAWGGSGSGDDGESVAGDRDGETARTTTEPVEGDDGDGLEPAATSDDEPSSSDGSSEPDADDPGTTDPAASLPTEADPFLPGVAPFPDALPTPPGGTVNEVGFLEVPGSTVESVRDFYVAELPTAGFTAGEPQGSSGSWVVPVTGGGVAGNLTITDVTGTVTVVWLPT